MFLTKFRNQRGGDTLRTPAVCQHFAEHGAKAHNQGKTSQGAADTRFDGANDFIERHSLHQSNRKRHQDESDETVHFEADHQE